MPEGKDGQALLASAADASQGPHKSVRVFNASAANRYHKLLEKASCLAPLRRSKAFERELADECDVS